MLRVEGLDVELGAAPLLKDISLCVAPGHIFGLVGESGSGKSILLLSLLGLLPPGFKVTGGAWLDDVPLFELEDAALCDVRGRDIAMVFQEPMTALNPLMTIEDQVGEVLQVHKGLSLADARINARATLERVELNPASVPGTRYPHELSGGQRQRVVIAMAIAAAPKYILADEPTTALDVTTQAQITQLLTRLAKEDGCGLIFVSHDLPLLASLADHIAILKDGEIVERGDAPALLHDLQHPYSKALFAAASHRSVPAGAAGSEGVLASHKLTCTYGETVAVDDVSFEIAAGSCMALIGESGCGKSTLARAVLGLQPAATGHVDVGGARFADAHHRPTKAQRRDIQMVFQDPFGSFNPRHTVKQILAEPFFLLDEKPDARRLEEALSQVGLEADALQRYPHQFSGGQRQRIAIARALITHPKVIVLDEAVSALDVSVRAQVLDLLTQLRRDKGLAYLFITHDLSTLDGFADQVLVMQRGRVIEQGLTKEVLRAPATSYTKALLDAVPTPLDQGQ